MAVKLDIEAIKRKAELLSGVRKQGNDRKMVKFEPGKYMVRVLPVDAGPEDLCWVRKFYYNIGKNSILAPIQFGKPDPVQDLIKKCFASKTDEDKQLAKKLFPKTRAFAPVIVRGQEDKGVQIWAFSPNLYAKMLEAYMNELIGDFRDPDTGFDLEVSVKKIAGKKYNDTSFEVARRSTKLSDKPEQVKEWLNAIPEFSSLYKENTTEEINKMISDWLASGAGVEDGSDGTEKTVPLSDDDSIEKMAAEIASTKKKVAPAVVVAKKQPVVTKQPVVAEESDGDDLDGAFDELLDSD